MTDDPVIVRSYADLISHDDLDLDAADTIARELTKEAIGEFDVVWLPEWLAEKKDLPTADGSDQVYRGYIERETEKAYHLTVSQYDDWVPKSQAKVFEAAPDAEIHTPQKGFDEFEEGGQA